MNSPTSNVSAIVFDLGNVLFDLDIPRTWRAMEKLMGVTFEHPFAYPPTKELMYAYECGEVDTGTFVGEIQRLCVPNTTPEQIVNAWNAMLLSIPAARLPFLLELKKRFPLYLLSNINALHLEFFYKHIRDAHGVRNWDKAYFNQTFYSNYIGMRKPNPEIYNHVIQNINIPAEEILFIDDNVHNINAAAKIGIQTIHLGEKEEVIKHPYFNNILNA